jgi:thiosulfate/3-mercaptopyruvate sulfurtransferase
MAAARFWWLMKLLGHRRVAVLDGGFARWTALGLPVDADDSMYPRGTYQAGFDTSMIASTEEVARRSSSNEGCLIDARAPERFRGEVEPLDPVAGHIPGALNRPYSENIADGRMRAPEILCSEFSALIAGTDPADVVLGCGSGVTACHNLLAMEYAGLHGARIFAASWSGWVSDRSRQVAKGR